MSPVGKEPYLYDLWKCRSAIFVCFALLAFSNLYLAEMRQVGPQAIPSRALGRSSLLATRQPRLSYAWCTQWRSVALVLGFCHVPFYKQCIANVVHNLHIS